MEFIKFPSIEAFKHVYKNVKKSAKFKELSEDNQPIFEDLPKIRFKGTVKLHGTNAGITFDSDTDEIIAQSRERIITPISDNAGFAFFVETKKEVLKQMFYIIDSEFVDDPRPKYITIFGEWAGPGIQKGVGINKLAKKSFFVFGTKITIKEDETSYWINEGFAVMTPTGHVKVLKSEADNIYNINDFKTFDIEIDFNTPEEAIKQIEEYVLEVEKECPVAKQFGFSGVGEGIVWKSNCGLQFKTKGEEHKVSRTKELVPIDEEKLNSIGEFINYAVTEARLNQGIEYVFTQNALEPSIEKVGDFLRWVQNDILKEELNALDSNGLTIKDVNPLISKTTVTWFKQRF